MQRQSGRIVTVTILCYSVGMLRFRLKFGPFTYSTPIVRGRRPRRGMVSLWDKVFVAFIAGVAALMLLVVLATIARAL